METTFDLPDELLRALEERAAREDRAPEDLLADLLRRGLGPSRQGASRSHARVQLPLIRCVRRATPDTEITPERAAQILADEEATRARG